MFFNVSFFWTCAVNVTISRACLEPYQLLNPKPDYLPTSPKPENSHIAIHQSSVITSLAQPKEPVCNVFTL